MICICNGRYYGGGFNPVPEALPDDGLLDILIIKAVSVITVAKVIGDYKRGLYKNHPDIISHHRATEITIRTPKPSVINVDGEALWEQEATFSIAPHKLRYFYPTGVTYGSI